MGCLTRGQARAAHEKLTQRFNIRLHEPGGLPLRAELSPARGALRVTLDPVPRAPAPNAPVPDGHERAYHGAACVYSAYAHTHVTPRESS